MKKYFLSAGYVVSRNDVDSHYINEGMLAKLYGVKMSECVVAPRNTQGWRMPEGLIVLSPKADGNYTLPKS